MSKIGQAILALEEKKDFQDLLYDDYNLEDVLLAGYTDTELYYMAHPDRLPKQPQAKKDSTEKPSSDTQNKQTIYTEDIPF